MSLITGKLLTDVWRIFRRLVGKVSNNLANNIMMQVEGKPNAEHIVLGLVLLCTCDIRTNATILILNLLVFQLK